jgi:hypothetical protein
MHVLNTSPEATSVSSNGAAREALTLPSDMEIITPSRSRNGKFPTLQTFNTWTYMWLLEAEKGKVYLERGEQSELHDRNAMNISTGYVVPAGVPFRIVNKAHKVRILMQRIVENKKADDSAESLPS